MIEKEDKMKSIICKAYHKKEKKWYWFDVLWGDEHGNIWMLPDGEIRKRSGGLGKADNRIRVDPLDWKIYVGLSPYMPSHLDLGNKDCCGIFNGVNDEGIVECNECGITINTAIELIKLKPGDTVKVRSAIEGAPDEVFKVIRDKEGDLVLDDVMGTEIKDINPQVIQKINNEEDCPICHGLGYVIHHHDPCTECDGSGKIGLV